MYININNPKFLFSCVLWESSLNYTEPNQYYLINKHINNFEKEFENKSVLIFFLCDQYSIVIKLMVIYKVP